MKGLVYKDIVIFFKGIDKRMGFLIIGVTALLLAEAGPYSGLFASVMFSMTVGMQNILSIASDEKAGWKKYQLAMPLGSGWAVASKYLSTLATVLVSIAGSLLFNGLGSVFYRSFDGTVWGLSMALAILLPMVWAGICLPFTYWFGFRSGQAMGLLAVVPIFFLIKYFEDGPGMTAMVSSMDSLAAAAFLGTAFLIPVSLGISVLGYRRKK